jgi:hypothetical protein
LALRPQRPQSRSEQLAEREAAQKDVLLREVDEALRQDEMLSAFRRYGRPAAAAIVLGLAGLAGYLWWDSSREEAAGQRGEQFTMALDRVEAGRLAAADRQLEPLAKESAQGMAAAAKLMRAGVALEQGRPADALFAEVAADDGAPKPFRDLAKIREVAVKFDAMPPQQVVERLKPLAVPGNPWFGSAGELLGIAYLKQGKAELAGPLFASIARDQQTPESLRARARQMAGVLGVDAIDDVAKAGSGSAAPGQ